MDNYWDFHTDSFFSTLSTTGFHRDFVILPELIAALCTKLAISRPKIQAYLRSTDFSVHSPINSLLKKFTLSPETTSKQRIVVLTFLTWSSLAPQNMRASSANYRWLIAGVFLATLKPSNKPAFTASLIILPIASATTRKRNGERGSPCLSPLPAWKKPLGDPLIKMENQADETSNLTGQRSNKRKLQ